MSVTTAARTGPDAASRNTPNRAERLMGNWEPGDLS
jgi:hypothetical protein